MPGLCGGHECRRVGEAGRGWDSLVLRRDLVRALGVAHFCRMAGSPPLDSGKDLVARTDGDEVVCVVDALRM